ncbi:MAG: MBL fold metallo-hydrolase [Halobacterium sp.]
MTVELRDGVWHLRLRGVNAYLLEDDGSLTLVDAGLPWQAGAVRRQLEVAGFSMRDVDRVLVTHCDVDHVGGLRSLLDTAGDVAVYCGARDADVLTGRRKPPLDNRKGLFQRVTGLLAPDVEATVEPVEDGDEIGGFRAVHAPGHTPGHTVYVHESMATALLGDLVRESDGEFELPPKWLCYDRGEARASVDRVLERAPDFEVGCVGHGDPLRRRARDALSAVASDR